MDLKHFDISAGENGVELIILDLDNKPTDIKIKLLSMHSKKGREALINSVKRQGGEVSENTTADVLSELTLGWSGISEKGKELVFSKEEARRVYETYPIIANQVQRFIEDARNFLKK